MGAHRESVYRREAVEGADAVGSPNFSTLVDVDRVEPTRRSVVTHGSCVTTALTSCWRGPEGMACTLTTWTEPSSTTSASVIFHRTTPRSRT